MKLKYCSILILLLISTSQLFSNTINYTPVKNFDVNRFLGTWYEIARLPAWFENDLENVTSTYTLKNKGEIEVVNSGINKGKSKTANGKIKFANDTTIGYLKLSFFGPFFSNYVIFNIDDAYQFALIATDDKYLWIFSRKPQIEKEKLDELIQICKRAGFDTSRLLFTYKN